METLVVVDEGGMDDELAERVESFYDELLAMEQDIQDTRIPQATPHDDRNGVVVTLQDGRPIFAGLPSGLVPRLLTVITAEELTAMVDAIARAVENPGEHRV